MLIVISRYPLLTRHALHSFLISIMAKTSRFNPGSPNSSDKESRTVTIPKEPLRGSYFGKCTCGVVTRDAVPCEHMAAVVVSSRIPQLTRANIMPYWWRTDHLQLQFPKDVVAACNLSIETIREDGIANSNVMYCPAWTAPNKAG